MPRSKRAKREARRAHAKVAQHPPQERPARAATPAPRPTKKVGKTKPVPFYATTQFLLIVLAILLVVGPLVFIVISSRQSSAGTPTPPPSSAPATSTPAASTKTYSAPPPMVIDPNKTYVATIETDKGTIRFQMLPKEAPKTVNNFIFLARDGFYDGLTFHRVESTVIQGGDPLGNGTGGPGYKFEDELPKDRNYVAGTVAMANSGPNTNGSQFFITPVDWLDLPKNYTIFGVVTEGMDVVKKIQKGDVMKKVTISEE